MRSIMRGELILHPLKWVCAHLHCWDLCIALLVLFISTCLIQRLTSKGPVLWPVLGIIPSVFFHFNHIYDWGTQSLIKAGGIFHFKGVWMGGAHGILTSDPSNIEYMLKTNFTNFPKGQRYRERFYDLLGNGIFNSDGDSWREQRRVAASVMHSRSFVEHSFEIMRTLVHHKLLKVLEKLVNERKSFDLQELLLRFTFDNICIAALGIDPGCLAIDLPPVPFAKAFEEATELTLFRFLMPPFLWKTLRYLELGYEKRLKEAIQIVLDFSAKTVAERKKELRERGNLDNYHDLLSRLLENQDSEEALKNIHVYPIDFCVSFILAGRDTTSVALAWFFWLVHTNPEVENRIVKEIRGILSFRACKKDEPNDVVFTLEELKRMVYLHASITESLRLYPSVPIEIKEALEDDVYPDGTVIKKGGWALYFIYSMARMESIWGNDCLDFKPERWIKEGKFVSDSQFKYAVFNAGPRLCVGKNFAYVQMKMVAASILLRYEVNVVNGHKVLPKLTTTLYMKNGLLVTLKPRSAGIP